MLIEGDIDTFYNTFRWENWKSDTMKFGLADGNAFYPFLWSFCKRLEKRDRKVIPIDEGIELQFDFKKQLR